MHKSPPWGEIPSMGVLSLFGKGKIMQPEEEDSVAQEAAEAAAKLWWDDLRDRSLGTTLIHERIFLWVGVMLRRVKPEASLYRFRSLNSWERLIDQQVSAADPEGPDFTNMTYDFFQATDNPWSVLRRERLGKYACGIGRIATLDQDIFYARGLQKKRLDDEQRLRLAADRKWTISQEQRDAAWSQASSVPTARVLDEFMARYEEDTEEG
jgi:hypothetical protein